MSALAAWLAIRSATRWRAFDGNVVRSGRHDGHTAFINAQAAQRGTERAARLIAVLEKVRADARGDAPLSLAMLLAWADAPLRTTDAHAKNECYETFAPSAFANALADANSDEPPIIRAARLYLDVCFFHPFNDGNGRAACLALDFVLTRAKLSVRDMRPIATTPRYADDPRGPDAMVTLLRAVTVCDALV